MPGGLLTLIPALGLAAPGSDFSDTVAITNARVEVGDGRVLDRATVLVQDGRIAAVGPNVTVPDYARKMDGTGLTVYPGFIDAGASNFLNIPEGSAEADAQPDLSEDAPPTMRVANRVGVRPELEAGAVYTPTLAGLINERKAGFTHLVLLPSGGPFTGQAALVELSGAPRRDAVVRRGLGFGMSFRRGSGTGYPNSLLGVHALLRQTLMDAQWYGSLPENDRPDDAALRGLAPLVSRRTPALFEAGSANEIERALRLRSEFGFPLVVVGGDGAYRHAARLKSENVPVVVSMDAPTTLRLATWPAAVRQERDAQADERWSNLALLEKAGVRFALSGRGTRDRSEFYRNLRRAVNLGLSKTAALRSLTLDAARIAGVDDRLGSVEVGKQASLIVTKGDFLSTDMQVQYMVIRDRVFRPDRERPPVSLPREREEEHNDDDGCGAPHGDGGVR